MKRAIPPGTAVHVHMDDGSSYEARVMLLARLVLYSTLGWLLSNSLECQWDRWECWSVVGLFWASEHMTRIETRDQTIQDMEGLSRQIARQLEQLTRDTVELERLRSEQRRETQS